MVRGVFFILLSATGFGLMPLFALIAYHGGANVGSLLFLRFAIAAIIFFVYCFFSVKVWTISKTQLFYLFIMGGILYALLSTCYFSAVKYIPASLAALLLYTYPAFVAILSFFIDKEKLTPKLTLSIFLTGIGMILVLGVSLGQISITGMLLALSASVIYSCYIVIGNRIISQVPPLLTSSFVSLFASLSFLAIGLSTHNLSLHLQWSAWMATVGIAILSTVVAILAFFAGIKYLGSTKSSILSTWEPVVATLSSVLLLHQHLAWTQAVGGIIVLSGAFVVVMAKSQKRQVTSSTAM